MPFDIVWLGKDFSILSAFLCLLIKSFVWNLLFLSVHWGTRWRTVMAGEWVLNRKDLIKQVSGALCSLKYHESSLKGKLIN